LGAIDMPLRGKKVLIIVENLPVPFDRRVWHEARTLRDAGAQVTVICPTGKNAEMRYECIDGIHIYRHPLWLESESLFGFILEYASALWWQTLLSWKVLFKHGFDIIHGCNPPDLIFLIAWQFLPLGKTFIFDQHDINPELYEAKFGRRGVFWWALRICEWLTFKTARSVISTNESYKNIAVMRGKKDPDDVFVVRSGPDLSRVTVVPPNHALKNGRRFLVGYVGVIGESEGIDLLLESVRHLVQVKNRTDIQFSIAGTGPMFDRLKQMSVELGVSDYVDFKGRVTDEELFELLSTSDVCVNPDRVTPMTDLSTMNKIMEYMAFGKPIVQFDVKEGRFSAQEASLYAKSNDPVDFADKIESLLTDEKVRNSMGEFGRRRVEEKLQWKYEAPSLIQAYLNAVR
jgi:glycosyltransferase involved in cell wall biosynthesis